MQLQQITHNNQVKVNLLLEISEEEKNRILSMHKNAIINSFLNEQVTLSAPAKPSAKDYAWSTATSSGKDLSSLGGINKKITEVGGINKYFEMFREFLFSGWGMAAQVALAMTEFGAIASEVAWAILLLYDAYQYFINKKPGSGTNLIIDIICLCSGGLAGKFLKPYVGKVFGDISGILAKFLEGNLGKTLRPFIEKLITQMALTKNYIKEATELMVRDFKMSWIGKIGSDLNALLDYLIKAASNLISKVPEVIGNIFSKQRKDLINYSIKMEPNLVQQFTQKSLSTLSPQQVRQWAGDTLNSIKIKAAEKFVKDYLTNKPIQEVLDVLDKNFGTHMGNLFASYVYYNKLSKERGKVSTGGVSPVDFGRDALYGDFTPEKSGSYQKKLAYNITQATK